MKIISYCLWGDNKVYNYGAIENAILAQLYYPDFKIWIYYFNNCITDVINKLKTFTNVILIHINSNVNLASNSLYRFIPAFEAGYDDIILIRDLDSFLSFREKDAVDEFIQSNMNFHIMRDSIYHKSLIMGGMWGCKGSILQNKKDEFYTFFDVNKGSINDIRGIDQSFLNTIIYPFIKNTSIIHASSNKYEDNCLNFKYYANNHIGAIEYIYPYACEILNVDIQSFNRISLYK